ncbi:MAG: hypothetical protein PHY12_09485 [Eubacteriales bacterium]|nr:hypothetical protein [Eubacteriales bacterium]
MNTHSSAAPPSGPSQSSVADKARAAREKAQAEQKRGSGGSAVTDERTLAKGSKLHK